jgi:hypothetical protein
MTFALAAGRGEADIRDVRLALEDIGLVAKGRLVSKKRLRRIVRERAGEYESDEDDTDPDGEDQDDESTESLGKLLDWFKGPQAAECRRVAGISTTMPNGVTAVSAEQSQRPSFIADYVTSMSFHN